VKKSVAMGVTVAAAVAIGLIVWTAQDEDVTSTPTQPSVSLPQEASGNTFPSDAAPTDVSQPAAQAMAAQSQTIPLEDEFSEDPAKMFKADASGKLVVAERTRINIEKLYALNTPEELHPKLELVAQSLPPEAYRQVVDLLDRYKNFTLAARQTYPPGTAPVTVEDAITQHEGLKALRAAHFGPEAAEAMYGREERLGRQLLDFMNLEKHEGLTMDEKAIKAQEMLAKSPELSAAYEQNRAAGQTPKE
jgi:hypothetical protein